MCRSIFIITVGIALTFRIVSAQVSATWPYDNTANWLQVWRDAGPPCMESGSDAGCARTCDLITPGASCALVLHYSDITSPNKDPATADVKVMYYVHGVAVSPWLDPPFKFTLATNTPALGALDDGVHDISIDVQSAGQARTAYHYVPMLLHLHRGGRFRTSPLVPLLNQDNMYADYLEPAYGGEVGTGSRVLYVDPSTRHLVGYPIADTSATPWHTPTPTADLYQEELAPHTNLFMAAQMWWQFPLGDPDAGKIYARAMVPKYDEDHPGLRSVWHHDRFPFVDGPRGVGWASAYVTGQVGSEGEFYFVESGGPLRSMHPDGTLETIVGWRVAPGKFPVFPEYSLEQVHGNMELVGRFLEGQYTDGKGTGFRTPLDVALDPKDEEIMYVAGYEDNCIWKVVEHDSAPADVTVFAGDVNHAPGYVNGAGHAARFNGPTSVVFDPICDCLYVADQKNDAVRKITRGGVVTTFAGSPGMYGRIVAAGNPAPYQPEYLAQQNNRKFAHFTVSAGEGGSGIKPDIFAPMTGRVDSRGYVLVSDTGFGSIRRINPATMATTQFANLQAGHWGVGSLGWTWFDVDRWGNSGERDGVYSCVFQGSLADGEAAGHPNEFYGYVSPNNGAGGLTHFIFNDWDPNPDGWGPRDHTDPPHYCWNVAVDPRGGVYLAGGGEHGMTRLRARRSNDPMPADYINYYRGKVLWKAGGDGLHPSFMLKFGSEAHNYLGFADAWQFADGATDEQLINAFEIPAEVRSDSAMLATLLNFIRLNAGPPRLTHAPEKRAGRR